MIELMVGTTFLYNGRLCEVSEASCLHCSKCVFQDDSEACTIMNCEQKKRHDGKGIFFEDIEEC